MSTDASSLFASVAEHPLTVLVFFRGVWCPFCRDYMQELNGAFRAQVEARGGRLVGITSQSVVAAAETKDHWKLEFDIVSQTNNALAQQFNAAITDREQTPLAGVTTEYPHGMAQPAVVALNRSGAIVYRWASAPSKANLGGAIGRPRPDDLWNAIDRAWRNTEDCDEQTRS